MSDVPRKLTAILQKRNATDLLEEIIRQAEPSPDDHPVSVTIPYRETYTPQEPFHEQRQIYVQKTPAPHERCRHTPEQPSGPPAVKFRTSPRVSDHPIPDCGSYVAPEGPLPATSKPVSLKCGENDAWLDHLCDGRGKNCAGRDPMTIPPAVLTAAGHPPRRTRDIVNAFAKGAGGDVLLLDDITEFGDIRQRCLTCVENDAEVRRCTTINCPFWPYRMGRNPHNPKRGSDPFNTRSEKTQYE